MNEEQLAKIESAVVTLLAAYDPVHMPSLTISKFVDRLKADPMWTDAEIVEMQTRVLRIVLYRQQHPEANPNSNLDTNQTIGAAHPGPPPRNKRRKYWPNSILST